MTRIIGGSAKGRRLRTPPGDRTRPTTDRVREALFSLLVSEFGGLEGRRFLDLYAGSGAVGLEAVSRGAGAVLVESDRRTAQLVRRNADGLGLSAEVHTATAATMLAGRPAAPFDVVFADPPYDLADDALAGVLVLLVDHGWMTDDGLLVVERSRRSGVPSLPAGLTLERSRDYGETVLHVIAPAGAA